MHSRLGIRVDSGIRKATTTELITDRRHVSMIGAGVFKMKQIAGTRSGMQSFAKMEMELRSEQALAQKTDYKSCLVARRSTHDHINRVVGR